MTMLSYGEVLDLLGAAYERSPKSRARRISETQLERTKSTTIAEKRRINSEQVARWRRTNPTRAAEINARARARHAKREREERMLFVERHIDALELIVALRLLRAHLYRRRRRIQRREAQRERRAQMGVAAVRAEWLRAQQARRARLKAEQTARAA